MSITQQLTDEKYQLERCKEGIFLAALLTVTQTVLFYLFHFNIFDYSIWNITSNIPLSAIGFLISAWILGNEAAYIYRKVK